MCWSNLLKSIADNNEVAARPIRFELPWRDERAAQVQAPVDQDTGTAGKAVRFPRENATLKPGLVAKIVGHETGKAWPECGPLVARMRLLTPLSHSSPS